MNKVKKILTTLMAATLTVSTGVTSMPMLAHNVKAESKAETISSDTNDMSQYKEINGISSQTVLGARLEFRRVLFRSQQSDGFRSRFFPLSIAKKCVEKSLEKLQRNRSFQCV